MKNKLFISPFESLTQNGFIAKSMCDKFLLHNNCIIRCMPDFLSVNEYDSVLSSMVSEQSQNIETIIQYVPSEYIEYHFDYQNIIVLDIDQFIRRNLSILDKASLADEIWVFTKQQKEFLGDKLVEKTKVVGYPYAKDRVANLFDNKTKRKKEYNEYYTVTDICNIENIESLIYNFILIFSLSFDNHLTIYVKNDDIRNKETDSKIEQMLERLASSYRFISNEKIKALITITTGNPYVESAEYVNLHVNGDCYINIDPVVCPDVITASYLGKYILSTTNVGDIIIYNDNFKIETYPANYRQFNIPYYYYNEYNSYPKISDLSLQDKLVSMNRFMSSNGASKDCYQSFNDNGFFT